MSESVTRVVPKRNDPTGLPFLTSCTKDLFWSGDTLHATTALHLMLNCKRAALSESSPMAVMRAGPSMMRALGRSGKGVSVFSSERLLEATSISNLCRKK